jgi:hypothetical protein
MSAFNDTIQLLNVSEVDLLDHLFTWSNKQPNPVLARLDRAFTDNSLNLAFHLSNLSSLPRPTSDHTPLLLTLSASLPKSSFFRFENFWLQSQSFLPSILSAWEQASPRADTVGQLVVCIKSARAAAKVWSRCSRAPIFLIHNCQFLIQLFDYYEEIRNLSPEEFQVRRQAQDELARAVKARATYWKQRSKNKAIQESDSNTAFHHAQATQRLRHNFIRLVRVDGNDIVNHEGKTAALTAFFSSIVGAPGTSADANLDSLYEGRSQPSNSLTDSFSEPETK